MSVPVNVSFADGFIKDDFAKQCEPIQGRDFLYTGKPPAVGQRTETQIMTQDGSWCRLSGIITEVDELPTFDQWVTTSSLSPPPTPCAASPDLYAHLRPDMQMAFPDTCPYPDCFMCTLRKGDKTMTLETLMNRCHENMGALQNQKLTGYAYLNFDFFDQQNDLPFSEGRIYKIGYKANDNKMCVWCVDYIEDVMDFPREELPQVFREWEIGREAAGVAPFPSSNNNV